jgi:hypothetical protein
MPDLEAATVADQAFCGSCGRALAVGCRTCQAPLTPGLRFCTCCGPSVNDEDTADPMPVVPRGPARDPDVDAAGASAIDWLGRAGERAGGLRGSPLVVTRAAELRPRRP